MGVNKVILLGNLGRDPELRYTPSGTAVANFTLATSERFTDKGGQRQDKTEWHNIVVWGKLAELANQYLKKGRTVFIEGRITTRSWDDRDGNKKFKTEIVATSLEFVGGGNSRSGAPSEAGQYAQQSNTSPFEGPPDTMAEPNAMPQDELPF